MGIIYELRFNKNQNFSLILTTRKKPYKTKTHNFGGI